MRALVLLLAASLAGCASTLQRLGEVGQPPFMSPSADPTKDPSWRPVSLPMPQVRPLVPEANALWRPGGRTFFADQRAANVGDLITVLVNIADTADMQNNSNANRTGTEAMASPNLMGLEASIPHWFPNAQPSNLVGLKSASGNTGTGEIKRNETITIRLAGVVTQVLPNGNLVVAARQQVRVNSELRELLVSGVIRPQDIASDNTVLHDRMAEARIAYGGRGQLTDVQTPRWGQQVLDIIMPF